MFLVWVPDFPKRLLRDHLGLAHAAMALVPMRRARVRPLGRQLPRPSHAEQRGQLVEGGELFQGLGDDCLGGTLWRGRLHHERHGVGPADHCPRENRHRLRANHVMGRAGVSAKVENRLLLDRVVCIQVYDVLGSVPLCHDRRDEGGPLLREPAARDLLLSRIFVVGTLQREEQEGETGLPPEPGKRRHVISSWCQQGCRRA